ncbi:MAG: hypothetical protein QGH40_15925, partial [bacterium]|nr:hypothetical protein [bacterium]
RLCNRCSAALQHLKAAESHSQKMGNHSYKAKILLEYGLINKDMGSNESATNFLLRALREARCSQLQDLTSQILEHLAEIDIVCVASEITD